MKIDETWYHRPDGMPLRRTAGGIVVRADADTLYVALVREKGIDPFTLPKGGIEPGETIQEAARREIAEETGFTRLILHADLGTRERLDYDKLYWTVSHYFLFQTDEIESVPTDVENHLPSLWFPLDDLPEFLWREQRELVETHREVIRGRIRRIPPKSDR